MKLYLLHNNDTYEYDVFGVFSSHQKATDFWYRKFGPNFAHEFVGSRIKEIQLDEGIGGWKDYSDYMTMIPKG